VTSGRRDRSSLSVSTLCDHPRPCSATPRTAATTPALLERTGAGRRHAGHCATYGPPVNDTLESTHYGSRAANRYTTTLEAAPVRAQDAPRRLDRSRNRQDGRQLHGAARHTATRREIVRHAYKSPSPWPIKGRETPPAAGDGTTDSNHSHAVRPLHDIGIRLNQYLRDLEVTSPLPPR
jgi:hypothetical protein